MPASPMDHVAAVQVNRSKRHVNTALIIAIVNVQDKQTAMGSVEDTDLTRISGLFMSFKFEKSLQ